MKTLEELLKRARNVTTDYLSNGSKWTNESQMLKIYEECGEFQNTKKKDDNLEEGCDIIYSVLTYWHLCDFPDWEILAALESTMDKIEKRSRKFRIEANP